MRIALGGRNDRRRAGRADDHPQRPAPGFLFGCQAFGYGRARRRRGKSAEDAEKSAKRSKKYIEQFDAAFNFATLPFYRGGTERELGKPDYSEPESILEALRRTRIITKGHPLIFLVPAATPDWLRNLSYDETKKHCLEHVRRSILRFRDRIHIWDVINEAHVQPDVEPGSDVMKWFGKDENVDLTVGRSEGRPPGRSHLLPRGQFHRHVVRLLHGPPTPALAAKRLRLPRSG